MRIWVQQCLRLLNFVFQDIFLEICYAYFKEGIAYLNIMMCDYFLKVIRTFLSIGMLSLLMSLYPLKVEKNHLVSNGKNIILRGFSIADPYKIRNKDKIEVSFIINKIVELGGNVIRVPIRPDLWQTIPNFFELYIDEIVDECLKNDIYCVLDWHAIGNPIKNQTRMKESFIEKNGCKYYRYDSNIEIAYKFWAESSQRYVKKKNVIFEVFNEPAPGEKDIQKMELSALYWKEWKLCLEKLIEIIRINSNNLILISPVRWAYNLSNVAEYPLIGKNIAYSVHPYPIHTDWQENFEKVVGKFALVVTEWGFMEKTDQDFLRSNSVQYGVPILNYMEENHISWIAWCFDKSWDPKIVNSWEDRDYSNWGKFITQRLGEILRKPL